jgi:hypothetical protein
MTLDWSIVEYQGRAGLIHLEADWRRLYSQMPLRTSYHTYEAQLSYVDDFMAVPDEIRCLVLREGRLVRAICLLEAGTDDHLGLRVPVWRTPALSHMRLSDVLCPEDEARRRLIPALVAHLRREPRGGRLLVLGPLPEESSLWHGLRRVPKSAYCTEGAGGMHVLDCTKTFDDMMARLSKKFRSDLRRRGRKLESLGDVRFVTATGQADLAAEFETFLDVEASGWKGAAGTRTAIRFRRGYQALYQSLISLHGAEDYCEINALYAEGRCIASQLCARTGGEYAGLKMCYDEDYSRVTPGLLLLQYSIERCCEDPEVVRMNWLNESAWQLAWHPDSVALRNGYLAIDGWPGSPLIALLRVRLGYARRWVRWARNERERMRLWNAGRRTNRAQ